MDPQRTRRSVLMIGAGYVGGSVLTELLQEDRSDITIQTRRQEAVKKLEALGTKAYICSLDDADKLQSAVEQHDIIINSASSDHNASVDATLAGIRKRSQDGKRTIYIGEAKGNGKIYSDDHPEDIDALSDLQPHRTIDKKIVKAAKELKDSARIMIILPPLIYGRGSGPFNQHSQQIPTALRASIKQKVPIVQGEGVCKWSNVHVLDLAEAYVTLLHALEQDKLNDVYYVFAESGSEHQWSELAKAYGRLLFDKKLVDTAEPKSVNDKEAKELNLIVPGEAIEMPAAFPGYYVVGGNSRSRAVVLRKLGWSPSRPDVTSTLSGDVDFVASEST